MCLSAYERHPASPVYLVPVSLWCYTEPMVILRGHHLICLNFFHGEGYDEEFIDNLRQVLSRVEKEAISVVSGADDVCSSCLWLKKKRCTYAGSSDQEMKDMDRTALGLLGLSSGDMVRWRDIQEKLPYIFSRWFSSYCAECAWRGACEKKRSFQELDV